MANAGFTENALRRVRGQRSEVRGQRSEGTGQDIGGTIKDCLFFIVDS